MWWDDLSRVLSFSHETKLKDPLEWSKLFEKIITIEGNDIENLKDSFHVVKARHFENQRAAYNHMIIGMK